MPQTSKERSQIHFSWQHKPLPTVPGSRPLITSKLAGGAIENIPRRRTSSNAAGELIRRVSNIFSSRRKGSTMPQESTKRRPPALNLGGTPQIVEASNLSEEDEEEDDIRRPSGLGRPVSISSLPPSPFSPSYKNNIFRSNGVVGNDNHMDGSYKEDETGQLAPSHMPFGYIRARATSTPNPLRSMSLRSRGSKRSRKGGPRSNSGISSHEGTVNSHCDRRVPPQSNAPLLPPSSKHQATVDSVTISSMPIETIALILTFIESKSSIARISHTCQLFFFASQTALYTHINLDDFESESQLEKFFALLSERQDSTDLVKSFRCTSWPTFFLLTTTPPLSSTSTSSFPFAQLSSQSQLPRGGSSSLIHPVSPFLPPDHQDQDPDVRRRNALLTATFTLTFQRMSNLTSLILPAYDHDLLAYHTAFGLREITFLCSTMSKEEGKALFGWLDGQINVSRLEFPNLLVIDGDLDYRFSGDGTSEDTNTTMGRSKIARPATSSGTGLLRQVSGPATIGGGNGGRRGEGGGKKYLVAPYLVPLNTGSSPSSPHPPARTDNSRTLTIRTHTRNPLMKLSSRPKSAAPDSPSYATFSEAAAAAAVSATNDNQSSLPSPTSPSQIPFPTSSPPTPHQQPPNSPLSSPTLLPNLSILRGPPSLIIALSSPTASSPSSTSPISPLSATGSRRPLSTISLNITTTLYSGLRPASIMTQLTGTARILNLRFGKAVDKRSVEKVLGAAGSSLGGSRERVNVDGGTGERKKRGREERGVRSGAGEIKDGFMFGRGEWKGLTELNVELTAGGPGSDEALHRMISSAIPRYPYLRVLTLTYIPPGALSTTGTSTTGSTGSPVLNRQLTNSSPKNVVNTLPTPPQSISPLPTTPTSFTSSTVSGSTATTANATSNATTMVSSVPPRNDSLKHRKKTKALSPPEQAYIRQWTKHCVDLERVVFLSGGEWVRGRNSW